jgi:plastocyanin
MELGTAFHVHGHRPRAAFHAGAMALLLPLFCAVTPAAPLELRLLALDGKPIAGAVVVLRATRPDRAAPAPIKAVMDQQQRAFVPHVLIVPVGSSVTFPNSDSVSHQVYSFSPAKKFQLPLYRGSPNPPVGFDRAGVVTIGCNIHDAMRAYIFVVDGQYYGRTSGTGQLDIPAVEPGEYAVEAWHPLAREMRPFLEGSVMVAAGTEKQSATLKAAGPLRLRAESTVPANWDAY